MRRLTLALAVALAAGGCFELGGAPEAPAATTAVGQGERSREAPANDRQTVAQAAQPMGEPLADPAEPPADEPALPPPPPVVALDGFDDDGDGVRTKNDEKLKEDKGFNKLGGKKGGDLGLIGGTLEEAAKEVAVDDFGEVANQVADKSKAKRPEGRYRDWKDVDDREGEERDVDKKPAPKKVALELGAFEIAGNGTEAAQPAFALDLGRLRLGSELAEAPIDEERPDRFLPRMCYFENTYLGGNAAYEERLRRLEADLGGQPGPHLLALLDPQPFDPPEDAGLRLTAALSQASLEKPGRVVLQVGLQGSRRHGWRRPPLDVALVVDVNNPDVVTRAADALLKRLGPQDRLAIVQAGEPEPISLLAERRDVRTTLVRRADAIAARSADAGGLAEALAQAGGLLAGADDQARVPGTRTLVVLTDRAGDDRVAAAERQAHALALTGVVTSVVALGDATDQAWWRVASAGNGNLHRAAGAEALDAELDAELASLSRVIARLLRVNVRLAPGVEAIRVIGSRVLGQEEVVAVKAREVATDQNLSRALGVKADRGDDDDGIQTVIPYFYGGDSHVVLIELWVDRPGAVAEISLRYKDMVSLGNAVARTSVALSALPRGVSAAQRMVQQNLEGFSFAEALRQGARLVEAGRAGAVGRVLRQAAQTQADRRLADAFADFAARGRDGAALRDALALAADRRIGASGGGLR
ncbi:MAG: VWA domain-containing protein [Myxococcales bacterium]|nr:VWA domain-containing protein [Myxococcales bacterium]